MSFKSRNNHITTVKRRLPSFDGHGHRHGETYQLQTSNEKPKK